MADNSTPDSTDHVPEAGRPSRRRLLAAGGAGVAVAGLGAVYLATSAAAEGTQASTAGAGAASEAAERDACLTLTQETTEGPYYLDYDKHRSDITENKPGVPLALRIRVVDSENCRPLRNVAVDIWHCDATGVYSSYEEASSGGGGGGTPPTGTPTGSPSGPPEGGGDTPNPTATPHICAASR